MVAHGAPRNRRYTHQTGGVNLSNPGEQAIELSLNAEIAGNYKNPAQRARLLTEHWVSESAFCPNCGHLRLEKYPNNRPVADFYCLQCGEDYELKSKQDSLGAKILDGSYKTKMERLQSGIHPNLFLLTYDLSSLYILDFFVIPNTSLCQRLSKSGDHLQGMPGGLVGLVHVFCWTEFPRLGKSI